MTGTKPKTFLSMLLALMLVFTTLPMSAFAAETDIHTDECDTTAIVETVTAEETTDTVTEDPTEPEPPVETEAPVETVASEEPDPTETAETVVEETEETDTDPYSGNIGDSSVAWKFDTSSGRLIITGSGDCETFDSADDQPWAAFRTEITEAWFYDMDTLSISDLAHWFEGCTSLKTAEIPYTTFVVGESAFAECNDLERVMIYYMEESFSITESAFFAEEFTPLEVAFIPYSEIAMNTLYSYNWGGDNRAAYFSDAYGMMVLASGYCSYCKGTYGYSLDYEQWTDDVHCVRHWCSNCGYDQCGGVLGESHTYSGGYCTKCGYGSGSTGGGGGGTTCYHYDTYTSWSGCDWYEYCSDCGEYIDSGTSHGSTYTEWDGCDWYEYCRDCDELMDYGTSHGTYSYGSWTYYNSSRHRRYYSCNDCGEGSYSYGYHSTSTKYSSYSSSQHTVGSYCSTCSSYIGSTSYESHSFSYGSWTKYSETQHRRSKTCSDCGYSTYEYASHSLTYGSWANYSDTQHRRSTSCSCGYSGYEYANHSISYGDWKQSSATEHSRTMTCSCGFSDTESEAHKFTYGEWKSSSDTEHSRSKACDCGYATTETEPHDLIYGDWEIYSEEEHKCAISCDCGYSTEEFGDHADTDDDGYCDDCDFMMTRFSVTVPASLTLTISKWGEVYAADNAEIVNNSTDAVEITGITLTAENGWSLVPYSTNMANAKVDAKQIGFRINNLENVRTGMTETLAVGNGWMIAKGDALPLDYDATVSATSDPISEQVLTIVFIVDWAA